MEKPIRVRFSGGKLVTNAFFEGLSLHWFLKGLQAKGGSSRELTCLQCGKPCKLSLMWGKTVTLLMGGSPVPPLLSTSIPLTVHLDVKQNGKASPSGRAG